MTRRDPPNPRITREEIELGNEEQKRRKQERYMRMSPRKIIEAYTNKVERLTFDMRAEISSYDIARERFIMYHSNKILDELEVLLSLVK